MASSDLELKAKEAFIDDHFELAVDLYTQAIALNPNSAELFADRAQANIKLENFTEAVADSNRAIELDLSMAKAYLRKAFLIGALSFFPEETGNLPKQSSENVPMNVMPVKDEPVNEPNQITVATSAKPKYRHEFYQKPEEVVVTIFAKGVPANSVSVDYGEQILSISIDTPGQEVYHFQPRLFGKIIPDRCRHVVLSTKIEVRLAKAERIHWNSLEFSQENAVVQRVNVSSVTAAQRPTYPSSKPKRVDWDKLEAQVKKEEKEEKLDGDAALNKFFQDIYRDADEDARRAMSKSFVESNGTVLSTNWKEVGSKKVEGSPPEGMEMKSWDH
ncbi:protein SGT1 homolog [Carica papaya]|uniref:protein SGT1 homolog n=1 Tax=Carica papaya TaxID=3649 RepID=UPI000B8CF7D6|nr:protein SGT1 homolog [Carica papaya]